MFLQGCQKGDYRPAAAVLRFLATARPRIKNRPKETVVEASGTASGVPTLRLIVPPRSKNGVFSPSPSYTVTLKLPPMVMALLPSASSPQYDVVILAAGWSFWMPTMPAPLTVRLSPEFSDRTCAWVGTAARPSAATVIRPQRESDRFPVS